MSNEPGWNAQRPGRPRQPQPPQQSPSRPPPPPPPNPPHPPPPPPPPPPHPNPPQQGGLAPNVAALLAYLFGWIGGLIIYLTRQDREVRFHAAQSILVFGGLAVLIALLSILNIGGSVFVAMIILLLYLLSFVLWIFLSIQGYRLKHIKLPVIGDIAERWAIK